MNGVPDRFDPRAANPGRMHACILHTMAEVPPFCPLCLGAGLVTDEQLDRWQSDALRQAGQGR